MHHVTRPGPRPTSSRSTSRPRRRSSATSPRRYAFTACGARARARADDDGLRDRRPRAASTRSPRPTPCSSPGCGPRAWPPPAAVLDALRAAHARGARVASICTGAFVLAHAGLLDGRRATTHWAHAERLAARYPAVTVDPERPLRRRGRRPDLGRRRRGHRSLPAPRAPRPRRRGGQRGRAADRRGAASRRRPGAVRRGARCPRRASAAWRATRAWALERLREPLTVAAMARHAALQRAHLRPALPRRDGDHAAAVAAAASASCTPAACWRRPTSRSRTSPTTPGFGTAASLRSHFRRATATTPVAYRRSFRGSPA